MNLGERLCAWRVAAGLSTTQAGRAAGLNQSYVCQIEHGRHVPSGDALLRLAKAYGCELAQLVTGLPAVQAATAAYVVNLAAENERTQQRRELAEARQRAENAEKEMQAARAEFEYRLSQLQEALELVQSDVAGIRVAEMYRGAEQDGFSDLYGQGVSLETRVIEALTPGPLYFTELVERMGCTEHELLSVLDSMRGDLADGLQADGLVMLEDVPDTVTSLRNVRNDAPEVWREKVRKALAARKRGTKAGDRYWTQAYQGGRA